MLTKNLLLSFLLVCHGSMLSIVHVFGDSHAYYCFSNAQEKGSWDEASVFSFSKNGIDRQEWIVIHYLGPITMHRIGRDGLAVLNTRGIAQAGDTVVFVFGEIDVRCHIGKQRDEKRRSLDEVINTLVAKYMRTIAENVKHCLGINVVVTGATPPHDPAPELVSLPMYGTLQDRIKVNNALCEALAAACKEYGYYFLDIRPHFSNPNGSLKCELSDGNVHVGLKHNRIIKEELFKLIEN